jgi:preprotein translocase subunit Sss1
VSPGTTRILVVIAVGLSVIGTVGVILYLAGMLATGNP